jgi:porin
LDGVPVDRPDGGIHLFAPGDGVFAIGEIALLSRADTTATMYNRRFLIGRGQSRPYRSKLAIGAWAYTTDFPDLSDTLASGAPVIRHGSSGAYLIGDWVAWSAGSGRPTTLALFTQLGLGDPEVEAVGGYVGAGLALTGLFRRRPSDQIGLAVASAQMGSHFRRAQSATGTPTTPTETTLDLTYVANVASWVEVHPDVQYVIHPGGTLAVRNALVPGIQIAVSRTF